MWDKIHRYILFFLVSVSLRFSCCTCIENKIKHDNNELINHSNYDSSQKQKGNLRRNLSKSSKAKTLNILALGGSTTWGARLKDRNKSYPYLLEQLSQEDNDNINYSVTNKAMRATDAYYPSLCIQSILLDTNDKEFHVILLEYSLNGPNGIDTLVKRLQYRFPSATFIYVHLYSLSTAILDNSGAKYANQYRIDERNSVQWHWDPDIRKTSVRPAIDKFFQEIGGTLYSLPRSKISPYEVMPLFSFDWHHLSAKGHVKVANDLYELIVRQQNDLTKNSPSSTKELIPDSYQIKWGYGDSCVNWFETGEMSLHQEGAQMNTIYTGEAYNQNKHALEFSYDENPTKNGGTVGIMNSHSVKVPLFITYLSTPKIYPIVEIHVDDHTKVDVNPDRDMYHVAVTQQIGFAEPGYNNIVIQPKHKSEAPFRLVGVALFGFHYNRNVPLRVAKKDKSSEAINGMKKGSGNEKVLNVLSLGGPVTWGGNLPNGEVSYPSRIGQITNNKVTNMGVRASDAYYPSLCIESMLGSGVVEYDVILLEYSNTNPMQHLSSVTAEEEHLFTKTEIRGLRMLVKRLQYRFPNAIIIYVHLYSLRHVIKDSHGHLADEHDEPPPDFSWSWAYPHKQIYRPPLDVKSLMKSVGGYVYSFPVPDTIKKAFSLFQPPTYESLSARGHRLVGDALAEILTKKAKFDENNVKHNEGIEGTWGWGDQCLSWLGMGGTIPIEFGGGQKRDMGNFQWSIEFVYIEGAADGGWIKVINSKEVATPLYFTYMIGGSPDASTIVSVNDMTTELSIKARTSQDKFQTTDVGWVAPGTTVVSIKPGPGSVLQLIGISLFGFYQHKELPLMSMHNTILDENEDK